jgi:hypothetical protein
MEKLEKLNSCSGVMGVITGKHHLTAGNHVFYRLDRLEAGFYVYQNVYILQYREKNIPFFNYGILR